MIRACLFDFDYTLVDSHIGIVTCYQIVLKRHGYTDVSNETIQRTIGKTLEKSFSILTGITDEGQLADLRKEYSQEANTYMTPNTFLFSDTVSVLNRLKESGYMLGILSTKYRFRYMEVMDKFFPPHFFDVLLGNEDLTFSKPHPESLLLAMEQLRIYPDETVYVGDSTVDAETAQRAKVPFIGVTTGMTSAKDLSAYPNVAIIPSLSFLPSKANLL